MYRFLPEPESAEFDSPPDDPELDRLVRWFVEHRRELGNPVLSMTPYGFEIL
jgi:hypothetical protein